ncbi:MAG: 6-phosphogluconolactonase [Verrucomicrobiales bacterium]|jgi:6-phosphogluconolactonase
MRKSITIALSLMFGAASFTAHAEEPLVFVSAFASGEKGAIHAFSLDVDTGKLKPIAQTTDVENPFFMALSPDNRFLYSIHAKAFGGDENEEVAAYALDGRSGRLKFLNRDSAKGSASCFLSVDATGKTVLVSNYTTGDVASLSVSEDGSLVGPVSYFKHEGEAPKAHCFVISPDNRFAFAADLGIDKVMSYRLDAVTATLTPNDPAFAESPPGSGPRHLTFHPSGKFVYVINEKGNTISVFDYAAETGSLSNHQTISTLPEDFEGRTNTADLKITPDGKFLYGTNRGHDSIAAYSIGEDGKLTLIEIIPSLGKGPQNLAISPGGQQLLCANMPGNNVVVFKIDSKTGKLAAIGEPVEIPMPSCIMIAP